MPLSKRALVFDESSMHHVTQSTHITPSVSIEYACVDGGDVKGLNFGSDVTQIVLGPKHKRFHVKFIHLE